jgi:hypothetical protein
MGLGKAETPVSAISDCLSAAPSEGPLRRKWENPPALSPLRFRRQLIGDLALAFAEIVKTVGLVEGLADHPLRLIEVGESGGEFLGVVAIVLRGRRADW